MLNWYHRLCFGIKNHIGQIQKEVQLLQDVVQQFG